MKFAFFPFSNFLPRNKIAVMLHYAYDNLITTPKAISKRIRKKVECLCCIFCEDNFSPGFGIYEICNYLMSIFVGKSRLFSKSMGCPMDICIVFSVMA